MDLVSHADASSQGLKYYYTGKLCKHGHRSKRIVDNGTCYECMKISSRRSKKNKTPEQKAKEALYNRERKKNRTPEQKAKDTLYSSQRFKNLTAEQRTKNNAVIKKWHMNNPESFRKAQLNQYRKNKPIYIMRSMLHRALNIKGVTNVELVNKLGYTSLELKAHLEAQFIEGMSWDNHGDWHIDHIYPIAQYIRDGIIDPTIIHALTNLQPLWAIDNIRKSDKIIGKI